jgi:hypothetical protein
MTNNSLMTATTHPGPIEFYRASETTSATALPANVAASVEAETAALYQTVITRVASPGETVPASSLLDDLDADR